MHARLPEPGEDGPLDLTRIAWDTVREATYLVEQRFSYVYPAPIQRLRHRLVVVPPDRHGDQRLVSYRLDVDPKLPPVIGSDRFGNRVVEVAAERIESAISFSLRTIVRRGAEGGDDARRATLSQPVVGRADFRETTHLTAADAELLAAADRLAAENSDPGRLARAISRFVHTEMRYETGATEVGTTAREAFAMRAGVCQDFSHVALALARRAGLSARYVSGHLIGEGATHAWVEFAIPRRSGEGATVLALDPTHDREITLKYVTVAVGRDYGDVAPTSGSYLASAPGELSAFNRVEVIGVRFDR
jgi:transglutaminase-like putative cysteine protease